MSECKTQERSAREAAVGGELGPVLPVGSKIMWLSPRGRRTFERLLDEDEKIYTHGGVDACAKRKRTEDRDYVRRMIKSIDDTVEIYTEVCDEYNRREKRLRLARECSTSNVYGRYRAAEKRKNALNAVLCSAMLYGDQKLREILPVSTN